MNLLLGLLLPHKRDKYLRRASAGLAQRQPRALLEACKAAGVNSINVPYLDRFTIDLDPRGGSIAEDVLAKGSYQPATMRVLPDAVLAQDPLFVNVGANIGTTCLNAAHRGFRRIVAFEPTRKNCALLRRNLANNGIAAEVHQLGLGSTPGKAVIHLHPTSTGRHSIKKDFQDAVPEEIEIRTLDSFGLQSPFVLWIDTEGYEREVLAGAGASLGAHCLAVCIEISPVISGAEDAIGAIDILRQHFGVFLSDAGQPQDLQQLAARIRSGDLKQMDLVCLKGTAVA
jgi:FkbM family methyltransferase